MFALLQAQEIVEINPGDDLSQVVEETMTSTTESEVIFNIHAGTYNYVSIYCVITDNTPSVVRFIGVDYPASCTLSANSHDSYALSLRSEFDEAEFEVAGLTFINSGPGLEASTSYPNDIDKLTITNCTFSDCYHAIEAEVIKELSITNSTFQLPYLHSGINGIFLTLFSIEDGYIGGNLMDGNDAEGVPNIGTAVSCDGRYNEIEFRDNQIRNFSGTGSNDPALKLTQEYTYDAHYIVYNNLFENNTRSINVWYYSSYDIRNNIFTAPTTFSHNEHAVKLCTFNKGTVQGNTFIGYKTGILSGNGAAMRPGPDIMDNVFISPNGVNVHQINISANHENVNIESNTICFLGTNPPTTLAAIRLDSNCRISHFRNNIIQGFPNPFYFDDFTGDPFDIRYNCTDGTWPTGYTLEGNIDLDPLFVDAANYDFHLQTLSPCIDAGDPNMDGDDYLYEPEDLEYDGSRYEIGAFHYDLGYEVKYYPDEEYRWEGFPWQPSGEEFTAPYLFDWLIGQYPPQSVTIEGEGSNAVWTPSPGWFPVDYAMSSTNLFKCMVDFVNDDVVGEQQISETFMAEDTEIELLETVTEHWLAYWVRCSQQVDEAFGDLWPLVKSVEADQWYYLSSSMPTRDFGAQPPSGGWKGKYMHFGKGYVVRFFEPVSLFTWNVPGFVIPLGGTQGQKTEYFQGEAGADYMPLDVLDIPEGVEEIGVFQDGVCIGGAVIDSSAVTVLCYTQPTGRTEPELNIATWGGRNAASVGYEVFNPDTGAFEKSRLIAGRQDYALVRLKETGGQAPSRPLELFANHPNPFNPSTQIRFHLPQAGPVELVVYNVRGQRVCTLLRGNVEAGTHTVVWQGTDENQQSVASGVYFFRLEASGRTLARKMLLLK